MNDIPEEAADKLYSQLDRDARRGGYHLNPDVEFTKDLVRGLIRNEERYGYRCCPCRLSAEDSEIDRDIICPCYYRDQDIVEHGACYCALYVSDEVISGRKELGPVPERRPPLEERMKSKTAEPSAGAIQPAQLSVTVWRCLVCGYLCGREEPPEICPICKAKKERFERFI